MATKGAFPCIKEADLGPTSTHYGGILVNAAFLLVTSACLMGQTTEIRNAPTPPVTSAPIVASNAGTNYGNYGGSCDSGCGCEQYRQKLCDRLKGMFKKGCNDGCQPTTCHTPRQTTSSCDSCQPKIHAWKHRVHALVVH